jgi:lantibiotic modifying enzyme
MLPSSSYVIWSGHLGVRRAGEKCRWIFTDHDVMLATCALAKSAHQMAKPKTQSSVHQSWRPLLSGPLRQRAVSATKEIIAALPDPLSSASTDVTLASGSAGLAVLCAYLSRAGLDDNENAMQFLTHAIDSVSSQPMGPSLYNGFTGIAWATAHLHEQLLDSDDEDPNEAIDEHLIDYLRHSPWEDDYDLISGLVGIGVYAIERLPRASAQTCLALIVERLDEVSQQESDGVTWLTAPSLLPEHQREECPNGYYNLGLAHGVPGAIALLGQVCAAGIAEEKARPLLSGAVSWLLRQQLPTSKPSSYSPWINPIGSVRDDCRLAWCYGDAGLAASLIMAARSINQIEWERQALRVARRAAARDLASAGVRDAGLCHGSAGLGHTFNRLFHASGEAVFRDAARYWFERTLEFRQAGRGIGGFLAYRAEQSAAQSSWEADSGLLEGAAGVALALLAASTEISPEWDRMLLLSPRSQRFTQNPQS